MSRTKIVREFFAAISAHDLDRACSLVHPDIHYVNGIGFAELHGVAQFRYVYAPVVGGPPTRMELHTVVEGGGTVAVEREDVQIRRGAEGEEIEIRLPGVACLDIDEDGLITAWRDYYDMEAWCRAIGRPYEHFQTWFALASQVRA